MIERGRESGLVCLTTLERYHWSRPHRSRQVLRKAIHSANPHVRAVDSDEVETGLSGTSTRARLRKQHDRPPIRRPAECDGGGARRPVVLSRYHSRFSALRRHEERNRNLALGRPLREERRAVRRKRCPLPVPDAAGISCRRGRTRRADLKDAAATAVVDDESAVPALAALLTQQEDTARVVARRSAVPEPGSCRVSGLCCGALPVLLRAGGSGEGHRERNYKDP
jgi:hypothetical protein